MSGVADIIMGCRKFCARDCAMQVSRLHALHAGLVELSGPHTNTAVCSCFCVEVKKMLENCFKNQSLFSCVPTVASRYMFLYGRKELQREAHTRKLLNNMGG